MQWNFVQWPRLACAHRGGAGALCLAGMPAGGAEPRPAPPGPPQRPTSLSQGAVVANEALDSSKLQFQRQVTPVLGQDPSRSHTESSCGIKDTGGPAGRGARAGAGWLSVSAGVLWETTGGCRGGRGG